MSKVPENYDGLCVIFANHGLSYYVLVGSKNDPLLFASKMPNKGYIRAKILREVGDVVQRGKDSKDCEIAMKVMNMRGEIIAPYEAPPKRIY